MDMSMMPITNPLARIQGVYGSQPDYQMGAPPTPSGPMNEAPRPVVPESLPDNMTTIRGNQIDQTLSGMMPEQRHAMYDKLLELINNPPVREKPAFMDRLAAGMMGIGGRPMAEVEAAKHSGYNRKMADYTQQFENTYKGAALEDRTNTADMRDWFNQQRAQNLLDREERLNRGLDIRQNLGQQQVDLKAQKQAHDYEIATKKLEHAKELARGGTLYWDRRTGEVWINRKNGNVDETDINDYTADELQELKTQGKLKEIQAEGTRDEKIQRVKDAAAKERNDAAIAGRKEVAATRGRTGGTTNENSQEIAKQRRRTRRAQEFVDANPDAANFIVFGPSGAVTFKTPSRFQLESTRKLREAARLYIDQDYQGAGSSSSGSITPGAGTTTAPPPTTQRGNATQSGGGAGVVTPGLPAPTADAALMNRAIAALQAAKKPQTPENIKEAMRQLKEKDEAKKGAK